MTDPELADATYIEPITAEIVAKIIEKERPDALLPTMAGPLASNRPVLQSALGTDRVHRGLAARSCGLAQPIDQGLDCALARLAGYVEFGQLLAACLTRGVECVAGAGSDPTSCLAHAAKALEKLGVKEEELKAIDKEIKEIVVEAAKFSEDAPEPAASELYTDVLVESY